MKKTKFPPTVSWLFLTAIIILVFMTIARFVFFYHFKSAPLDFSDSFQAFSLGLKYDLRIVAGIIFIPFLLSLFGVSPFKNKVYASIYKAYFLVICLLLVFLYVIDFQHFDYLQQRLNAGVINFTQDAKISAHMVWETYPVFSMLMIIVIAVALLYFGVLYFFRVFKRKSYAASTGVRIFYSIIFTLLLCGAIFGRLNQYPLRWSDAFDLEDDFRANLALNPVQSFMSTLEFRNSGYDEEKVREYYPLMAKYLNVQNPDVDELNFLREIRFEPQKRNPNIVLVICESFSSYKSSMWNNPLNTTPFFNEMSKQGIFFDRCFTPAYGTARGIWATITGIPDVQYPNTASRNPAYVDQHTIINDFTGYEKFYFIGGSSSWANIRGLLSNNIEDLQLYEEESFQSESVDVWGISDKRLFLEANKVFKEQKNPFFAIIQTADNHRPYTIPGEDKKNFDLVTYPDDTLTKYGFQSNDELNAFRYSDFAFKTFMEAARAESYFENTIFVFVGDHGLKGHSGDLLPKIYDTEGINAHHVPLLFFAPDLLAPQRRNEICSQADVLPSLAALANMSFSNTTLGRNLFDTLPQNVRFRHSAFIYDSGVKSIGTLTDEYFYRHNLISNEKDFISVKDNISLNGNAGVEQDRKEMEKLTEAWYETAKYMLHHNRKSELKAGD